MFLTNDVMYVIFFVLCVLGTQGKPSMSFSLPRPFSGLGGRENRPNLKAYSGKRFKNDSIRMVYFHDETVAVVELGPKKLLLNCELIEVYESGEAHKALGELKDVTRPVPIAFKEMIHLMKQCKQLDDMVYHSQYYKKTKNRTKTMTEGRGISNPFTLFSGIIPGTKWCGPGDIAKNYFDLGAEQAVDSCCREHDLCPVKIRSYSQRYNLTNQSLYTKSHCKCDDLLFDCLKIQRSQTARIMGNIYFNLVQVPCIEDTKLGRRFRNARNNF